MLDYWPKKATSHMINRHTVQSHQKYQSLGKSQSTKLSKVTPYKVL